MFDNPENTERVKVLLQRKGGSCERTQARAGVDSRNGVPEREVRRGWSQSVGSSVLSGHWTEDETQKKG